MLVLFDISTDLLVRLQPGSSVWEGGVNYEWLRKYGIDDDGPLLGLGVYDLRERIAAHLRAELPLGIAGVRTALVTHLSDRLDGMDDQISRIAWPSAAEPDRALALKETQFWKQVGGIVKPDDAELQTFVPPHDLDSLKQWRAAVVGLNSIEDKMALFDRFATIADECELLEATVDYVVSEIETAGEMESDRMRGA